jgi:hypothetical protein
MMNKILWQTEYSSGHLWHRYLLTLTKSWWRLSNFQSDDFNLTTKKPWLCTCSFFASNSLLSKNIDRNHKIWNIMSTEIYMLHNIVDKINDSKRHYCFCAQIVFRLFCFNIHCIFWNQFGVMKFYFKAIRWLWSTNFQWKWLPISNLLLR